MTIPVSLFERQFARNPRALFLAAAAIISDDQPKSLAAIGLSGEQLASTVDRLGATSSETDEALRALTLAIAFSDLPSSDQQPYANALGRRQEADPFGERLADFTDYYQTQGALRGESGRVWLACLAAKFSPDEAWMALAGNPAAQRMAAACPETLIDQAIKEGELPDFRRHPSSSASLSPELLVALAARLSEDEDLRAREEGLRFACESLESLAEAKALPQARALALHALDVLSASSESDSSAAHVGALLRFANLSDHDLMPILAGAADRIELLPGRFTRRGQDPHYFLFAPNGHGGVHLPAGDDERFPKITLADYALALGDGPSPNLSHCDPKGPRYSPELHALAEEMRSLGLGKAIEARGTPAALRKLAELECQIETEHHSREGVASALESLALLSIAGPSASHRPVLRV